MKKFKLMLVAFMAMFGVNAFAQPALSEGAQQTIDGINYEVLTVYKTPNADAGKINTVKASLNGFSGATITIPDEVTFHVKGTDSETTPVAIDAEATFQVTVVGSFANLASATAISVGANVTTIDAGAFAGTSIKELDLSGTKLGTLNKLFEDNNTKLEKVLLPASLTNIATSAFANCAKLSNVTFATLTSAGLTIGATAFNVTPSLTTLTLPDQINLGMGGAAVPSSITFTANALQGSSIATLTFSGKSAAAVNNLNAPKLETVTFSGEFSGTIATGAFTACPKLATVNFNDKITGTTVSIATGSFGTATAYAGSGHDADADGVYVTINYSTKTDDTVNAFANDAFGTSTNTNTKNQFKLVTTTSFNTAKLSTHNSAVTAIWYNLAVSAAEPTAKLAVYTKAGTSSYYYAKFFDATKAWKIEKKQGDATVVVYGAYVDAKDAKIYMENLHIVNGFYWVPAGTPVIVKSNTSDDVTITDAGAAATTSELYFDGIRSSRILAAYYSTAAHTAIIGQSLKELKGTGTGDYEIEAKTTYNTDNTGYVLYFVAPIEEYGFAWAKISDSRVLGADAAPTADATTKVLTYNGDFYIRCNKLAAASRLEVVWLDGSEEEATAIKSVKKANAENGAIYNLAGQKVNAAYKGVVIKDGKKYIQK
jgi:hypothetical protein